jgi:hypothetical protein
MNVVVMFVLLYESFYNQQRLWSRGSLSFLDFERKILRRQYREWVRAMPKTFVFCQFFLFFSHVRPSRH